MSTLCRLSFLGPETALAELQRAWPMRLRRLAQGRGLESPQTPDRALPESVLAYVFEIESARLVAAIRADLAADPAWQRALEGAAPAHDVAWSLDLYATDLVSQEVALAGGTRTGGWLHLDAHDGLPSVLIFGMASDADGRLYLGAYEGLCQFDGASATLRVDRDGASGELAVLDIDGAGRIWAASQTGALLCFIGDRALHYGAADGPLLDATPAMCVDATGAVCVIGSAGESWRFDGRRFQPLELELPDGVRVLCAHVDPDGGLLLGTDAGLYRPGGRIVALPGDPVSALCTDALGHTWVGAGSGIHRLGPDGPTPEDALAGVRQASLLLADADGSLWMATRKHGLAHWDGSRLTERAGAGLASTEPRALHQDRRGCVWAAAFGAGLSRFDGCWIRWIRSLTPEDGMPSCRVETLCEDAEQRLWIGTWGEGVLRLDGGRVTPVAELQACGPNLWSSLLDHDGRLWLGTHRRGACCWDGRRATFFGPAEGLGHESVWGMHQDRRGRLWFATQGGGLTCLDGGRAVTYTTADGLPHDQVWDVLEDDDGAIWCSTFESGLCRFDGRRFERFTAEDGLASDQVWCLHRATDGRIWCGTWGGGVSCWDGSGFATYTTRDGLSNNSVRTIQQTADGHLWFGTFGGGVSRYDGRVFQTLSRREGLAHDGVQSIVEGADGRMWIATENGVTCYRPPKEPPTVRIDGVVADRRYTADEEVVVLSSQQLVTFEFSGTSFSTTRERLAYTWRLRGHDDSWQTTRRRRAELGELPEGRYTFEVCAVDRDLNTSPPARAVVTCQPDADHDRLRALRAELATTPGLQQFIGRSASLQRVLEEIDQVAPAELTVLVLGETGTGKGLAAQAIHSLGPRRDGPFLQVNCGAIPEGLVESELFGHERGAFTGAVSRRIGRFELAEGGTLFLDEIGDLPLASQRALLQVLQEGTFHRVGGQTPIRARARIVAATNRDLLQATRRGAFREDLYYRLTPFVLHLPPLRERREDVPLLMGHFLERFSRHLHRPVPSVTPEVVERLQGYDWPGNVRELEHLVQRAVLVCRDHVIRLEDLPLSQTGPAPAARGSDTEGMDSLDDLDAGVERLERDFLRAAMEAANWVIYGERGAARRLKTHPEKLRRRLRRLGLSRPRNS